MKFVKSLLRDTSEYSGMMECRLSISSVTVEDGLKTGGKAPNTKRNISAKKGGGYDCTEFTDNSEYQWQVGQ